MAFRCADCGEQSEAEVEGACPSCGARVRDAEAIADALEERLLARSARRRSSPVGIVVAVAALGAVIAGAFWLMSREWEEPPKKEPRTRQWLGPKLAGDGSAPDPAAKPKPRAPDEVLKEVLSISDPRLLGLLGIARGRDEWSFFSHTERKAQEWRIDPEGKRLEIADERGMGVAAMWDGHVLEAADGGHRLHTLPEWEVRGDLEGMASGSPRPARGSIWFQVEGAELAVHRAGKTTSLRIPPAVGRGSPALAEAAEDAVLVRFESSAATYRLAGEALEEIKTHAPDAFGLSPAGRYVVSTDAEGRWVVERLPGGDVVLAGYQEPLESGRAWYSPGETRAVVMIGGRLAVVDLESGRPVGNVHHFRLGLLSFLGEKRFALVEPTRLRVFEIALR